MTDFIQIFLPRENVNDDSMLLQQWLVESGAWVEEGQPIAAFEGSKATFEVSAPRSGYLQYTLDCGSEIPVAGYIGYISQEKDAIIDFETLPTLATEISASASPVPVNTQPSVSTIDSALTAQPSPLPESSRISRRAAELLAQHGLTTAVLPHAGLIRHQDVQAMLSGVSSAALHTSSERQAETPTSRSMPVVAEGVPYHSEPLTRSKRLEGKYLASAAQHTLSSTVTVVVPTRGLQAAMQHFPLVRSAIPVIVYEAARLLRKFPVLNACCLGDTVHYYDEVNIGVAMDAGQGLKVPVIRQADTLDLKTTAATLQELLVSYLNADLPVTALAGGTFTVTDLSNDGAFVFQPLLNQGQAAILGIGSEFFLPESHTGLFSLILTFDHQLAEGRMAATFLNALRDRLAAYETAIPVVPPTQAEPNCSRCLLSLTDLKARDHRLLVEVHADLSTAYICTKCILGW